MLLLMKNLNILTNESKTKSSNFSSVLCAMLKKLFRIKDRIQDSRANQKVQKLYLKNERKKRHGIKKVQFLHKVNFYHINVYQLQSTGIIVLKQ